jgi:nicotinate-nucleotide adenylyltransferase
MRLAIFGGSFDPPHIGHLIAIQDAFDALELDKLVLVPASSQPLKRGGAVASPRQRLAMTRLLAKGDPRFEVSAVEVERGGVSYTVDTLDEYAAMYPAANRFLILGADALAAFGQWREPERILQMARVAILRRKGAGAQDVKLPAVIPEQAVVRLDSRLVDVSSTEIRARVKNGKSVRGFVTDDVAAYIASEGLYR